MGDVTSAVMLVVPGEGATWSFAEVEVGPEGVGSYVVRAYWMEAGSSVEMKLTVWPVAGVGASCGEGVGVGQLAAEWGVLVVGGWAALAAEVLCWVVALVVLAWVLQDKLKLVMQRKVKNSNILCNKIRKKIASKTLGDTDIDKKIYKYIAPLLAENTTVRLKIATSESILAIGFLQMK